MASGNLAYSQVLTRSRTLLFLSFRDTRTSSYPPRHSRSKGKQKQADDVEQEALLNHEDDETAVDIVDSSALPPKWVDLTEEVEELAEQMKRKMVQLDKLTAKHVLPGFTDRSLEERQIEALTAEITQGFRKCQLLIGKIANFGLGMEAHIRRSNAQKPQADRCTSRDVMLVKNAQIAIATKVQALNSLFQKRQRLYLQQLRGYETPSQNKNDEQFAIENESSGSGAHPSLPHEDDFRQQQTQTQVHQVTQHGANPDLEQRSKEIDGIGKSISELADMFQDLGNLVLDQGTLLDRIDYNIEQMSTDVRGAVEELTTATHHQKRSGKCRIIFLLILLIFAAILVLVYKPRHVSNPEAPVQSSNSAAADSTNRLKMRSLLTIDKFYGSEPLASHVRQERYRGKRKSI